MKVSYNKQALQFISFYLNCIICNKNDLWESGVNINSSLFNIIFGGGCPVVKWFKNPLLLCFVVNVCCNIWGEKKPAHPL